MWVQTGQRAGEGPRVSPEEQAAVEAAGSPPSEVPCYLWKGEQTLLMAPEGSDDTAVGVRARGEVQSGERRRLPVSRCARTPRPPTAPDSSPQQSGDTPVQKVSDRIP